MILQQNTDGNVKYTLSGDAPPTALAWVLKDNTGKQLSTGTGTAPTAATIASHTRRGASDDHDLTIDSGEGEEAVTLDATVKPGATLRVTDARGRIQDVVCTGVSGDVVGVAGLVVESSDTFGSLWCPDVVLTIPGTALTKTGDGYALHVTVTEADDSTSTDVVYFAVTPYHLQLPLSVRTYLDYHPELALSLTALSRRKDWSRLCDAARDVLETRIRANGSFIDLVCSTSGLRKALAEALHTVIAASYIPELWKAAPGEYLDRVQKGFEAAVDELLSASIVDNDMDGTPEESERNEVMGVTRLRL